MKKLFDEIAQRLVNALYERGIEKHLSRIVFDAINVKVIEVAVTEISLLELRTGDTIVLKTKDVLSNSEKERLKQSLVAFFPEHQHKIILLEKDMDITVISK